MITPRAENQPYRNFVKLPQAVLCDCLLSDGAVVVYAYLQYWGDPSTVRRKDLGSDLNISRRQWQRLFRELMDNSLVQLDCRNYMVDRILFTPLHEVYQTPWESFNPERRQRTQRVVQQPKFAIVTTDNLLRWDLSFLEKRTLFYLDARYRGRASLIIQHEDVANTMGICNRTSIRVMDKLEKMNLIRTARIFQGIRLDHVQGAEPERK